MARAEVQNGQGHLRLEHKKAAILVKSPLLSLTSAIYRAGTTTGKSSSNRPSPFIT